MAGLRSKHKRLEGVYLQCILKNIANDNHTLRGRRQGLEVRSRRQEQAAGAEKTEGRKQ